MARQVLKASQAFKGLMAIEVVLAPTTTKASQPGFKVELVAADSEVRPD